VIIAAAVVAAGLIAGSVALLWPESLAERDPAGALACAMTADYQTRGSDKALAAGAVGEQAAKSATESIRVAGGTNIMDDPAMEPIRDKVPELRIANLEKMHAACVQEGVDMPPWVK
jgi:hypothetical protein